MRAKQLLSIAVLSLVVLSGVASATIVARGNVEARFNGALQVQAHRGRQPAPARLFFRARLGTVNGEPEVPELSGISLALSPRIEVDTRGLPLCHRGRLHETSSGEALRACRDAKVGQGSLIRRLFTREGELSLKEELIAFNGRYQDRRAILVHTENEGKLQLPRLLFALTLEKTAGGAAYTLTGALPPYLRGSAVKSRIAEFTLSLGRSFAFKGTQRSYLTASCPTAAELATHFTVAHMTLDFGEEAEPLTGAVRGECGPPPGAGS